MSTRNVLRSRAGSSNEYIAQTKKGMHLTMKSILSEDPSDDPEGLRLMCGPVRSIGENIGAVNNIEMADVGVIYPDDSISTTFLFKGVIVEYRPSAGQVRVRGRGENKFDSAYLVSYVTIGIPAKRFNWLKEEMKHSRQNISYSNFIENQGYYWVTAKMNNAGVSIDMYDEDQKAVMNYGSACDVMSGLQTNLVVLAGTTIRMKKVYKEGEKKPAHFELSFVLSMLQMYDITNVSSPPLINTASVDVFALKPTASLLQKIAGTADVVEEPIHEEPIQDQDLQTFQSGTASTTAYAKSQE